MTSTRLQIAPLTPTIGAEIEGVDLARAMDPATGDAVYAAILEHLVVFFRDQQHHAVADYLPEFRCMHRITVINDRRAGSAISPAA